MAEEGEECGCGTADCGAEDKANTLMTALRESSGVTFPDVDLDDPIYQVPPETDNPLYGEVTKLTNTHLTERKVDGLGTFDILMTTFSKHLEAQHKAGRLTGAEYTKAYVELTTSALNGAISYLLQRDQTYWATLAAQQAARAAELQAVTARVQLAQAKYQLVGLKYEALNAEGNFALTKMRLATSSIEYCTQAYNLENLLPQQLATAIAQTAAIVEDTAGKNYNRISLMPQQLAGMIQETNLTIKRVEAQDLENTVILPKNADMLDKQILQAGYQADTLLYTYSNILPKQVAQLTAQTNLVTAQVTQQTAETTTLLPQQVRNQKGQADISDYQVTTVLPKQVEQVTSQIALLSEQKESQRAQTLDTRTDGTTVSGVLGKQKQLQDQQITSYKRDAEVKAAKFWTDAWITMKTIDEGLDPPDLFTNANLNAVLTTIKEQNDL